MPKDFLDFEYQIELNEKHLDKYHDLFETTIGKISLISISYSIIVYYAVQFVGFALKEPLNLIFIIALTSMLLLLCISVYFTIRFLIPINIAHLHEPQYFYNFIKNRYTEKIKNIKPEVLNKYIQASYLSELEQAVSQNYDAFKIKRSYFYYAFNFSLISFIPYIICLCIYLPYSQKTVVSKFELTNTDSIIKKIDSFAIKIKR